MPLRAQWEAILETLSGDWSEAQLQLRLHDGATASRAAGLLGPAQPFRAEPTVLRFASSRTGTAPGPDGITRLLARLDEMRIDGRLELVGTRAAAAQPEEAVPQLAEAWDAALAEVPSDWSDLLVEVVFTSSDHIEPGAVFCVALNPRRDGLRNAFRFRVAHRAGYGASPGMVRRCFERCDAHGIHGAVDVLRALSDSRSVGTQGPVWQISGKTV